MLERLGLAELAERCPRELSGGQRQRVALGRALATDPALLLLDEPLSALDLPLRGPLRDELRGFSRDFHIAAVLVTHDLAEAYRLGDRIVVYEDGRVIQAAPRAELLWQPASRGGGAAHRDPEHAARHRDQGHARSHPAPLAGADPRGDELADARVPARRRTARRVLHPPRVRAADPQGPGRRRRRRTT